jgi:hypothetical protein
MSGAEIKKICLASYASDGTLYGDVPDDVIALAKGSSKKKE